MHLWVRSSTPNVDLQATVSEVRPDGHETFVQGGWVRGERAQARPEQEHPARAGPEPAEVRRVADAARAATSRSPIPLYYEGHAYRAGSRIRVTISAPNGDQPIWSFGETQPKGHAKVSIAYSKQHAVEADPPDRARHERPDRAAAVPGPARRAVPQYQPFANRSS